MLAKLSMTGRRELANDEKVETWHRIEQSYGTSARSIEVRAT